MWLKLRQRELLNDRLTDYNKAEVYIREKETVKINISAIEPAEGISVRISTEESASVNTYWCEEVMQHTVSRTVNILENYHKRYESMGKSL